MKDIVISVLSVVHSAPEQEQCLLAGLVYIIPNTEITDT